MQMKSNSVSHAVQPCGLARDLTQRHVITISNSLRECGVPKAATSVQANKSGPYCRSFKTAPTVGVDGGTHESPNFFSCNHNLSQGSVVDYDCNYPCTKHLCLHLLIAFMALYLVHGSTPQFAPATEEWPIPVSRSWLVIRRNCILPRWLALASALSLA